MEIYLKSDEKNKNILITGCHTLVENATHEVQFTDNPVQEGFNVSDSAVILPKILELSIIAGTQMRPLGVKFLQKENSPKEVYEKIVENLEGLTALTVVTDEYIFKNMYIQRFSSTASSETGKSVVGSITFKEIITVEAIETETIAQKSIYKGQKQTKEVAPEAKKKIEKDDGASILSKILGIKG